jgi:hypothetical protein
VPCSVSDLKRRQPTNEDEEARKIYVFLRKPHNFIIALCIAMLEGQGGRDRSWAEIQKSAQESGLGGIFPRPFHS